MITIKHYLCHGDGREAYAEWLRVKDTYRRYEPQPMKIEEIRSLMDARTVVTPMWVISVGISFEEYLDIYRPKKGSPYYKDSLFSILSDGSGRDIWSVHKISTLAMMNEINLDGLIDHIKRLNTLELMEAFRKEYVKEETAYSYLEGAKRG